MKKNKRLKAGVQFHNGMSHDLYNIDGFSQLEYQYDDLAFYKPCKSISFSGIEVRLERITDKDFENAINFAAENGAKYIIINTINIEDESCLDKLIFSAKEIIRESGLEILIENGAVGNDESGYEYGAFSDSADILSACYKYNEKVGASQFGAALNVGYANLLAINIRVMAEALGRNLRVVHASDNDGRYNLRQLPYTFTSGRGTQMTDWNFLLGSLMRMDYEGYVIFDTVGLFDRSPVKLYPAMLRLLEGIANEWEEQFHFEDKLGRDKKIILFGAGKMASNYIRVWGEKHRPAFLVDNNSKNWGNTLKDVEIKSPSEILSIPSENRIVVICNAHYNDIMKQLTDMQVDYICYNDEYYG